MENSIIATQNAKPQPFASLNKKALIRSFAISIIINGGLPVLIYYGLTHYTAISGFVALVLTGVPSCIDSIVGIIRRFAPPGENSTEDYIAAVAAFTGQPRTLALDLNNAAVLGSEYASELQRHYQ